MLVVRKNWILLNHVSNTWEKIDPKNDLEAELWWQKVVILATQEVSRRIISSRITWAGTILTSATAIDCTSAFAMRWLLTSVPVAESHNCTFPTESTLMTVPSDKKATPHTIHLDLVIPRCCLSKTILRIMLPEKQERYTCRWCLVSVFQNCTDKQNVAS